MGAEHVRVELGCFDGLGQEAKATHSGVGASDFDILVERIDVLTERVEAIGKRSSTVQLDAVVERIDSTIMDLNEAKYLIACDCLSLARGDIKDKLELATINWVFSQAKGDVSRSITPSFKRGETNGVSSIPTSSFFRRSLGRSVTGVWTSRNLRATGSRWSIGTDLASNYHLKETVWDASLLLGWPGIGWPANCILFIGLLANILTQMAFCGIVVSLPNDRNFFTEDAVLAMTLWRTNTPVETLTSVCDLNETLSTDYLQWSTLSDATEYSRPFTLLEFQIGPMLCRIVLIAWTLWCVAAMRSCLDFMFAVHNACDRSSRDMRIDYRLQRFSLTGMPVKRVIWADVLGIIQILIAVVLLIFGSLWLIATTRTSDLVLNAVALTYIMEIDELIFLTVVPRQVSIIISNLHPLDLRRRTGRVPLNVPIRALLSLIAIFSFVGGMSFVLDEHISKVTSVVTVMCGWREVQA